MNFDTYAGRAVLTAVDLVNSEDGVHDGERLAELLARRGWVVEAPVGDRHLARFRSVRHRLRQAFDAPTAADAVAVLNAILADHRAVPHLTDHDGAWHWHYAPSDAALVERVSTGCVAALLGVIAHDNGTGRLRACAADGCDNVFVDATRNGKRRFCDSRACGNRTHAAAYRARGRA